jgi:hypothetical protein
MKQNRFIPARAFLGIWLLLMGMPVAHAAPCQVKTPIEQELQGPEAPKVSPVPCFENAEGKVLFRIDGIPVHEGTFNQFVSIYEKRRPRASKPTTIRRAIEEGLIPQAAMYAAHQNEVAALSKRAASAYAKLKSGATFKEVVVAESDDPNRTITFGSEGVRRRLEVMGLQPPSATLEDKGFSISLQSFSEPFVTPMGLEIVYVDTETPSQDPKYPDAVQRELFRILFSFNEEYAEFMRNYDREDPSSETRLKAFKAKAKSIIELARIELVDSEYAQYIYPFRLKR